MKETYSGIGVFWSWDEEGGESYCGDSFEEGNTYILLKGYVNPKDVEWGHTIFLNVYDMNYEKEIRLLDNVNVEIDEIIINKESIRNLTNREFDLQGKNILIKPMLIPT